jgi:sec-independent protein translocase protein TatC
MTEQRSEPRPGEARKMTLWEHVGELRRRLIRVLVVFGVALAGGLAGAEPVFEYLIAAAPSEKLELNAFSPWDAVGLYVKIGVLLSLIIAVPYAFFELWAFVKPGLSRKERALTLRYVPWALLMLLAGLAFAYFVVFPMAFLFTERVTLAMGLKQTYGVGQYFAFMLNILLPVSLLFELPLVILFLTRIGILSPRTLIRMRRVAWFLMVLIATMITPPDVISDLLVSVPLIALYEFSVWLSKVADRRRLRALQESLGES